MLKYGNFGTDNKVLINITCRFETFFNLQYIVKLPRFLNADIMKYTYMYVYYVTFARKEFFNSQN